jgi:hypothetical protein
MSQMAWLHRLQPFSADPIRRLPQHYQCLLRGRVIDCRARTWMSCRSSRGSRIEQVNRVFWRVSGNVDVSSFELRYFPFLAMLIISTTVVCILTVWASHLELLKKVCLKMRVPR